MLYESYGPRTRSRTQNLALIWCQTEHKSAALPVELYGVEQVMGIEPTSQPWQGRVLTVVLHLHLAPWCYIRCHYSHFLFLQEILRVTSISFSLKLLRTGLGWMRRLELPISRATIWRFNQLSYTHHIKSFRIFPFGACLLLTHTQPFPSYDNIYIPKDGGLIFR